MAKNPIKSKIDDNFWNTWDDGTTMISAYSKFFDGEGTGVIRDSASGYGYRGYGGNRGGYGHTGYEAIQPGHDVRPEFTRDDYDYFRPGEAVPQYEVQRIIDCNRVYNTVGIIKQMIDLMSEFCSKGITPNHKNPRIQKILRAWFAKVNGPERSERFINIFYRLGTTIAKRLNKNLSRIELEGLRKSLLLPDDEFDQDDTPSLAPIQNGFASIPCRYTFLNPICVEHEDHELAPLLPRPQLRVRLRPTLVKKIEEQGGEKLDVRAGFIYLNPNDIYLAYHKKDDWRLWGISLIEPILADIFAYQKLRLADLAALDSVISKVRIWKLGNLEHKIIPSAVARQNLSGALKANTGGGAIDVVWTPDIDLLESKTDTHQFLGSEKYKTVMSAIYGGLGIPMSLTGESQTGGTASASLIQLKTVTERLNYGRNVLTEFWLNEFAMVCAALGVKTLPTISYDNMVLQDDVAIKGLLNQLVDRNIISEETLQERYGENPELEESRIKRQHRKRVKNPMSPQKAGPWNNPERVHDLMRIAMQNGYISAEDVEKLYELNTSKPIKVVLEKKLAAIEPPEAKGVSSPEKQPMPNTGRPKGIQEKGKRKPKSAYSFASVEKHLAEQSPGKTPEQLQLASALVYLELSDKSLEETVLGLTVTPEKVKAAREFLDGRS